MWSTGHAGDSDFAQNESCTVQLERGCYVAGEAVNQEYHITARVRIGSAEFVMGECSKAPIRL